MEVAMDILQILSEPFYALHAVTFFSYLMVRHAVISTSPSVFCHYLFRRELQTLCSLAVLISLKWRKRPNVEALLGDGLFYAKGALIVLATILDQRLATWYLIAFSVIFLLCQQPSFRGLGNVVQMTPLQLENYLSEGDSTRWWLIEFRAVWSPQCIKSSRVFSNLSSRYTTEVVSFGSVDIGRFPKAGELYEISLGVNAGELPTYVMFRGETEIARLSSSKMSGQILSESMIVQHFELDQHVIYELEKSLVKK